MKTKFCNGRLRFLYLFLVATAALGCGDSDPPPDAGRFDGGGSDVAIASDVGPDAPRLDAGSDLGACDGCLIGDQCFDEGMVNADQSCEICNMATSATAWSPNDGAACEDGLYCTDNDICTGSTCGGTARDCSDGVACNGEEVCNDDTDTCDMVEAICAAGEICDSDVDMCICMGCVVDEVCYADGAANPDESCQVCDAAVSAVDWSTLADGVACDDGLFCTGTNLCGGGTCSISAGDPCAVLDTICDETSSACVAALHAQTFDYTGATEGYVVRAGATQARITVLGAAGGIGGHARSSDRPGFGAEIQGVFAVMPGQELTVMVGEQGYPGRFVAGGGGGSFVWDSADMLLIAAGGGGGGGSTDDEDTTIDGIDASTSTSGTAGASGMTGGGVDGTGGTAPSDLMHYASGGAGWMSDGADGTIHGCSSESTGGQTPLAGGAGGSGGGDSPFPVGGYGGGGGGNARCGAVGGGGGGGYSGGAGGGEMIASEFSGGGGGGSFNSGTTQNNTAGVGMGNGQIIIEVF